MFIDYVTLMLVNTAAGFFILGGFLLRKENSGGKAWAPAFTLTGSIALITGALMTFTWPLPGSYNIAFGELSALFGGLMLAAAWSLAKGLDMKPLGVYAFFAGLAAVVTGIQFMRLGLSQKPVLSGIGFLLAGAAGLGTFPVLKLRLRPLYLAGAAVLMISGLIWAYTGYTAYWYHLENFMK